jgi:Flp pilus assembly protein TadG
MSKRNSRCTEIALPLSARRRKRRERSFGQAMVETALTLTIYLMIIFAVVDLGRAIYYRNAATRAADAAARVMTLPSQRTTDCTAQAQAVQAGNGLSISLDPSSVYGNGDPRTGGASPPTTGQGYIYLWPALAQSAGTCTAGSGHTRAAGTVVAQVTIAFQPWTPLISQVVGQIRITSDSALQTEYSA